MKKSIFALVAATSLLLVSCGATTYADYTDDIKGKIVTNITNITNPEDTGKNYSVDYFTKTIDDPIVTTEENGKEVKTRTSHTLTYKLNDGYRLTEYVYNYETEEKTVTSDVLYDIKHATLEEDVGENVYYIYKYEYDVTDQLYSVTGVKDIILTDVPTEEQEVSPLWKELFAEDGLIATAKSNFYSEVLSYGDINDVTEANFRSLYKGLLGATLSYNSFIDSKQYIIEAELSNTDVLDMNLDNVSNLFSRNRYFISDVTINGTLGTHCAYDLKAIFLEDTEGIFSKEVKELTAPADDQLKPSADEDVEETPETPVEVE